MAMTIRDRLRDLTYGDDSDFVAVQSGSDAVYRSPSDLDRVRYESVLQGLGYQSDVLPAMVVEHMHSLSVKGAISPSAASDIVNIATRGVLSRDLEDGPFGVESQMEAITKRLETWSDGHDDADLQVSHPVLDDDIANAISNMEDFSPELRESACRMSRMNQEGSDYATMVRTVMNPNAFIGGTKDIVPPVLQTDQHDTAVDIDQDFFTKINEAAQTDDLTSENSLDDDSSKIARNVFIRQTFQEKIVECLEHLKKGDLKSALRDSKTLWEAISSDSLRDQDVELTDAQRCVMTDHLGVSDHDAAGEPIPALVATDDFAYMDQTGARHRNYEQIALDHSYQMSEDHRFLAEYSSQRSRESVSERVREDGMHNPWAGSEEFDLDAQKAEARSREIPNPWKDSVGYRLDEVEVEKPEHVSGPLRDTLKKLGVDQDRLMSMLSDDLNRSQRVSENSAPAVESEMSLQVDSDRDREL